jgi:hypothetical protein
VATVTPTREWRPWVTRQVRAAVAILASPTCGRILTLAHTTRTTRSAAYAAVKLGHDLDAHHPLTRDALAAGLLHVKQAKVVIRWVDRLPDDLGAEVLEKAERHLLTALAAPKHVAATQGAGVERPPSPEAMGKAFVELIERYPADRLPQTGGVAFHRRT